MRPDFRTQDVEIISAGQVVYFELFADKRCKCRFSSDAMDHPKKSATQHLKKIPLRSEGLSDMFSSLS